MKTENETSGSPTGTTSPSGHASKSNGKSPAPPEPGRPAPTGDESAYLAQQAADAQAAIKAALADIGTSLGQAVNVGSLTRQHPWLTLGASTVAGFVAAAVAIPSKEDQALRKLAKIERALNPQPARAKRDVAVDDGDKDSAKAYKKGKQSFGRAIVGEVIKAVQPALMSVLTAGVTAKAAKPSPEEMHAAVANEEQKQNGVPPTEDFSHA